MLNMITKWMPIRHPARRRGSSGEMRTRRSRGRWAAGKLSISLKPPKYCRQSADKRHDAGDPDLAPLPKEIRPCPCWFLPTSRRCSSSPDGDDEVYFVVRVEQVYTVQFTLTAGGNGDSFARDALLLNQILLNHLYRHLAIFALGLNKHDGPDEVAFEPGQFVQLIAAHDAVAHGILPGGVLGEDDRQFDHLLVFQFQRGG